LTYLPVILVAGTFGSLTGQPHWLTTLAGWRRAVAPGRDLAGLTARVHRRAAALPVPVPAGNRQPR